MNQTENYNLNLYQDPDPLDLDAGYNVSMTKIDAVLHDNEQSANSAQSTANQAVRDAAAAQTAADNAQGTADLAYANMPKGNLEEAVATASDVYAVKPLEVRVKGQTVQNLWKNPSGTTRGITVTANSDGSISVSGTSTAATPYVVIDSYILRPSTTYTLSIDKAFSQDMRIGCRINEAFKGFSLTTGQTSMTFTTPATLTSVEMGVLTGTTGTTVSGTYRVMLNEGSEAEPWCPPGINGVDELSIVTAGKNLFTPNSNTQIQGNGGSNQNITIGTKVSGIPTQRDVMFSLEYRLSSGAGTVTVQQDSEPYASLGIRYLALIGDGQWHKASGNVTVNDGFNKNDSIRIRLDNVTGLFEFRNIQLELGSTATAYEPPSVTTTPIDLDGHTLNSLPDGTRDELHIDGGGNVVLEKRVGEATAPTSAGSWFWETAGDGIASFTLPAKSPGTQADMTEIMRCDKLPVRQESGEASYSIVGTTQGHAKNPAITSTATAATVVGGATYIYPLAEPQTISLGTVELPQLPAPNLTAWAETDVPADISIRYVKDIDIVLENLGAAMGTHTEPPASSTVDSDAGEAEQPGPTSEEGVIRIV